MELFTIEARPVKKDQEIEAIAAKKEKEKKMIMDGIISLIGEEFMTQAIEDHIDNVGILSDYDKKKFNEIVKGELRIESDEFKEYAKEVNEYLNKKGQDSGSHSDPRQNLIALMRCLLGAKKKAFNKRTTEALTKEADNSLMEIKKENPAVGDYLAEMVKKYMPKLRNCDLELIRDYNRLSDQYLSNFEEKLRDYFNNETTGNDAPKTSDGKINLIENHPRYHFYKVVCETKGYIPKKVTDLITL